MQNTSKNNHAKFHQIYSVVSEENMFEELLTTTDDDDGRQVMAHMARWAKNKINIFLLIFTLVTIPCPIQSYWCKHYSYHPVSNTKLLS